MADCKYCRNPVGFFNDFHEDCQERFTSTIHTIMDMCREAALCPSLLDDLAERIRDIAPSGHITMSDGLLQSLLVRSWRHAVDEIINDRAFSTENQHALNQYRRHFGLTGHDLDDGGHFEVFKMMTMLKSLSDDGILPRFDRNAEMVRSRMIPFNLMRSEALIWSFREVNYLKLVTRLEERLFRSNRYITSMEETDKGMLGITTKHIYFTGFTNIFRVKLENIVSFKWYGDGFGIMRDTDDAKPEAFTMGDLDSWFSIHFIHRILEMEDMVLPNTESPTLDDIIEKGSSF